jgi:hypothetical protein
MLDAHIAGLGAELLHRIRKREIHVLIHQVIDVGAAV